MRNEAFGVCNPRTVGAIYQQLRRYVKDYTDVLSAYQENPLKISNLLHSGEWLRVPCKQQIAKQRLSLDDLAPK